MTCDILSINGFVKSYIQKVGDLYPNMMTVVDKSLTDNPLIYVNSFFEDFTGYTRQEVLGKNCRFLQTKKDKTGPHIHIKSDLSLFIQRHIDCCIDLKNYKKDGTCFYNRLCIINFGDNLSIGLQNSIESPTFNSVRPIPPEILKPFFDVMDVFYNNSHPEDKILEPLAKNLVEINQNIIEAHSLAVLN